MAAPFNADAAITIGHGSSSTERTGVAEAGPTADWSGPTFTTPSERTPSGDAPPRTRRRKSAKVREVEASNSSDEVNIGVRTASACHSDSQPSGEQPVTLNSLIESATTEGEQPAALILQNLGQRFAEARKLNKAESWRQLQLDLMTNIHNLCPHVLPLKDMLAAAREIEEFVKGSSGQVGRSNEELMAEFLGGKGTIANSSAIIGAASDSSDAGVIRELDMPDQAELDRLANGVAVDSNTNSDATNHTDGIAQV